MDIGVLMSDGCFWPDTDSLWIILELILCPKKSVNEMYLLLAKHFETS